MIEVKFYEEVKDENEETFGFLYLAEVKEFEKLEAIVDKKIIKVVESAKKRA